MIAETWRVVRAFVGYALTGRRAGIVVLALGVMVALVVTSAVSATVPLALYPFL